MPIPKDATLTWDAGNRLVKAVVNGTPINYAYDHLSRLISRSEGVAPTAATRYIYDGWNRLAEYLQNSSGLTLKKTYFWGMDLSGSMQGAGGVGGLLMVTEDPGGTSEAHYFPTYDGNGNVSEYLNASGVTEAHCEYDPFGNLTIPSATSRSPMAPRSQASYTASAPNPSILKRASTTTATAGMTASPEDGQAEIPLERVEVLTCMDLFITLLRTGSTIWVGSLLSEVAEKAEFQTVKQRLSNVDRPYSKSHSDGAIFGFSALGSGYGASRRRTEGN